MEHLAYTNPKESQRFNLQNIKITICDMLDIKVM